MSGRVGRHLTEPGKAQVEQIRRELRVCFLSQATSCHTAGLFCQAMSSSLGFGKYGLQMAEGGSSVHSCSPARLFMSVNTD